MSKEYRGYCHHKPDWSGTTTTATRNVVEVWEHGQARELLPRNDLRNHSPDGFGWGYSGSGPAQLALALCVDLVGDFISQYPAVYQKFKNRVVSSLPADGFRLEADTLMLLLMQILDDLGYNRTEMEAEYAELLKIVEVDDSDDIE